MRALEPHNPTPKTPARQLAQTGATQRGCMCAHSSHKLAKEMGASHALMKALANQCDFQLTNHQEKNCPAVSNNFRSQGVQDSAAFGGWNTLIPATLGAAFLLMFALFTE